MLFHNFSYSRLWNSMSWIPLKNLILTKKVWSLNYCNAIAIVWSKYFEFSRHKCSSASCSHESKHCPDFEVGCFKIISYKFPKFYVSCTTWQLSIWFCWYRKLNVKIVNTEILQFFRVLRRNHIMSCCPKAAWGELKNPDYKEKGTVEKVWFAQCSRNFQNVKLRP